MVQDAHTTTMVTQWQWWLYTRVWLCKMHDAMCHGFGKEPPRLTGSSDAMLLLRGSCRKCGRTDACCCRAYGGGPALEWDGWTIVRPPAPPARPKVSLLGAAYRDVCMLWLTQPTQLLDRLWIGSALDASHAAWVRGTAVTGIVNVTAEVPNFFSSEGVDYLNWVVRDERDANVDVRSLEVTARFIDRHLNAPDKRGTVFVHCFVGRSRSVAVCCYYLITRRHYTLYEAYQEIRRKRPIAQINTRFVRALQESERLHGGRRITDGRDRN